MKLKTKFQDEDFDLGEVTDVDIATMPDGRIKAQARAMRGGLHTFFYETKAEFDADWEDAPEEPKEYWHIVSMCAGIQKKQDTDNGEDSFNKEIGNKFETEEEAELAVRKLQAWKRLKDNGFKFESAEDFMHSPLDEIHFEYDVEHQKDVYKDICIILGGKE